jgi:hypothetical protein
MPPYLVTLLIAACFAGGWLVISFVKKRRLSPAELDRRRRAKILRDSRSAEVTLTDYDGATAQYSYSAGGVVYQSSQDFSLLRTAPPAAEELTGSIVCRYATKNPGNSLILDESWSGLASSKKSIPNPLEDKGQKNYA